MLFILLLVFVAVAVLLAWFLISRDRGEKEPIAMLWLAAGFGLVGALMASWLESKLIQPVNLLPGAPERALLFATLTVGIVEEACKFIPLAFVLYKRRYFNERTDGVIYFALAGLGFGLPENIIYTIENGTKTGIGRLLLTPIFHAAITGMIGYFLAQDKVKRRSPLRVIVPLAVAMLLHGLYDFGLTSGSRPYQMAALLITLSLSVGLFVVFLRATEQDQDDGLSVVGHNAFCRTCGQINPRRHLYCVYCGNNA